MNYLPFLARAFSKPEDTPVDDIRKLVSGRQSQVCPRMDVHAIDTQNCTIDAYLESLDLPERCIKLHHILMDADDRKKKMLSVFLIALIQDPKKTPSTPINNSGLVGRLQGEKELVRDVVALNMVKSEAAMLFAAAEKWIEARKLLVVSSYWDHCKEELVGDIASKAREYRAIYPAGAQEHLQLEKMASLITMKERLEGWYSANESSDLVQSFEDADNAYHLRFEMSMDGDIFQKQKADSMLQIGTSSGFTFEWGIAAVAVEKKEGDRQAAATMLRKSKKLPARLSRQGFSFISLLQSYLQIPEFREGVDRLFEQSKITAPEVQRLQELSEVSARRRFLSQAASNDPTATASEGIFWADAFIERADGSMDLREDIFLMIKYLAAIISEGNDGARQLVGCPMSNIKNDETGVFYIDELSDVTIGVLEAEGS